ncbi:MAG TPA: hypothetical protein VHG89_06770 [Verrucomicrobiae bacterium]|nr:hypothetical protein [Verrucomicrobiae bacterium]
MKRILFWTFIILVVAIALWASFAANQLTNDQNMLIWAIILCMVCVAMACGLAYLLFYCWKNRIAMIAGRYGGGRQYSRDTQPFRYWGIMIFYLVCLWILMEGICMCISKALTAAKHLLQ